VSLLVGRTMPMCVGFLTFVDFGTVVQVSDGVICKQKWLATRTFWAWLIDALAQNANQVQDVVGHKKGGVVGAFSLRKRCSLLWVWDLLKVPARRNLLVCGGGRAWVWGALLTKKGAIFDIKRAIETPICQESLLVCRVGFGVCAGFDDPSNWWFWSLQRAHFSLWNRSSLYQIRGLFEKNLTGICQIFLLCQDTYGIVKG